MVASDRVSAFDVIMREPIPHKGRVLTAMTVFWCDEVTDIVPGTLLCRRSEGDRGAARGSRPPPRVGRTGRAGAAGRDAPDGVHRARLPGRPGPRGVRAVGDGARHPPAGRAQAGRSPGRAHVHPLDQGGRGARRQHRLRAGRRPGGRRGGARGARHLPRALRPGRRPGRRCRVRAGRHQVRARSTSTACSACATRCARPTRRACGRPTRWCPAPRLPPSTSSPCATGWPPSPGTARRPRPRCPRRVTEALSARYVAAYERVTGLSLADWYGATA